MISKKKKKKKVFAKIQSEFSAEIQNSNVFSAQTIFFRIQLPDKKCFLRFVSPEIRISRIRNSTLYNPTLDIKKAFDTVKHDILLDKLNYNGILGPCLKLLTSYLTNRKQYVYLSGYKSSFVDVECGVPQGSVLGPILFIFYVNDMITALHCTPRLFTDDTCLFLPAKNTFELEELGNSELSSLKISMDANKPTVNPTKSKFIVVNSKI